MSSRKIEPLNEAEKDWIKQELENARNLAARVTPKSRENTLSPKVLDSVFKACHESRPDIDASNATINAIGMAFGQYLCDKLGFEWVAVTDEHGCEIAVVALPETAEVLVFPLNIVAKRWVSGTTDFLWYLYRGIEEDLAKFREDWEAKR